MSILFVDSTSELTNEQIKKLGIECINIPFLFDGQEVCLKDECDYDKYYSKFKKGIEFTPCKLDKNLFVNAFEPVLQQNDDIIYIHQSSNIFDISSVYEAKEHLKISYPNSKIELIDSSSFSIGYGILSYLLALKYRNGASIEELIDYADEIGKVYSTYILTESLEKLIENKILNETGAVSSVLSIKTIINIDRDGNFTIFDKTSGKKKAIANLINIIRQTGENVADFPIGIVYTNNLSDAEDIKLKIIEVYGEDITILMQKLNPANVSTVGTGILGITFHSHKKYN